MGGLICILGNVWLNPLAELLGSTPAIHREAICYLWYIVTFSPFLLFSFLLSGLVRNDNRPKLAMFALMVGSLSNVVLDYVFLYPMNMGIAGAALATALAAYLVIGYLMLILLTIFLGMAQGLQPVFSYFAGAGEPERSRALLAFAIRMFLAIGVLCYLLVVLFSREFFSVFNQGDVELIDFMEQKSRPYFCGFFLAGFNILMIAFWQATRHTQRALAVSLSRSVIWLPILTAVLPQIFGSEVIWLCHSLSELLTAEIAFGLLRLEEVDREIQMQKGIDRGSAGK